MMISPWVREYVGIAYADADCWDLVRKVYSERYGRHIPDRNALDSDSLRTLRTMFTQVPLESLVPGDAVVFREGPVHNHVGLYAGTQGGSRYVLHTTLDRGHSYLERLDGKEFENADARAFRPH